MWERNLIADIIFKAIMDYSKNPEEVEKFFKSKWGRYICDYLDLNAEYILNGLKNGTIKIQQTANGRLI